MPKIEGIALPNVNWKARYTVEEVRASKSLAVTVWLLLFIGCAGVTPPSRAAFTERILEPLATAGADERIAQAKANVTHAITKWKREHPQGGDRTSFLSSLGSVLGGAIAQSQGMPFQFGSAMGGKLGRALEAPDQDPDAVLAETLAWLDTRRAVLKEEILAVWNGRIRATGDEFVVCTAGVERHYGRRLGFPRLEDGPGPCPTTPLKSLTLPSER